MWLYFSVFVMAGVLGGQAGLYNAYIVDCSSEGERSGRFGFAAALEALGFAVGSIGGSTLELEVGSSQAVFMIAFCVAVAAVVSLSAIPESLPVDGIQEGPRASRSLSASLLWKPWQEFMHKADLRMWLLLLVQFLKGCILEGLFTVSLFAYAELLPSWSDQDSGYFMSIVGLASMLAQGLFLPALTKMGCGDRALAIIGLIMDTVRNVVNVILLVSSPSKHFFFMFNFSTLCLCWFGPVFTKFVVARQQEHVGLILGVFQTLSGLTNMIAPLIFTAAFAISPLSVFIMTSVFTALQLIALVIVLFVDARQADA